MSGFRDRPSLSVSSSSKLMGVLEVATVGGGETSVTGRRCAPRSHRGRTCGRPGSAGCRRTAMSRLWRGIRAGCGGGIAGAAGGIRFEVALLISDVRNKGARYIFTAIDMCNSSVISACVNPTLRVRLRSDPRCWFDVRREGEPVCFGRRIVASQSELLGSDFSRACSAMWSWCSLLNSESDVQFLVMSSGAR